jgi:hypothetical protein
MLADGSSLQAFIQGVLTTVAFGILASAIRDRVSKTELLPATEVRPYDLLPPPIGATSEVSEVTATGPSTTRSNQASPAGDSPAIPEAPSAVGQPKPVVAETRLSSQLFTVPRIGDRLDENCDATATSNQHQAFAIADGASQSFNSGDWARLITTRWVASDQTIDIKTVAERCSSEWQELSTRSLDSLPPDSLIRKKMAEGSSATFGGIRSVRIDGGNFWEITIIGDILVVVTQRMAGGTRSVLRTLPFSIGSKFGEGAPHQVTTDSPYVRSTVGIAIEKDAPGLEFVMMTDAVARCIFDKITRNINIADLLPFLLPGQQSFTEWVTLQRTLDLLDDDDSTVLDISEATSDPTELD